MENEKIEKIYKIASKLIKALNEKDLIKTLDVIQEAYEEDLVEEVSRFIGVDLSDLLSKIYTFLIAFVIDPNEVDRWAWVDEQDKILLKSYRYMYMIYDLVSKEKWRDLLDLINKISLDQKLTAVIDDLLRKNGLIYINDRPAGVKEIYNLAIGGYIRDLYLLSGEKDYLKMAG